MPLEAPRPSPVASRLPARDPRSSRGPSSWIHPKQQGPSARTGVLIPRPTHGSQKPPRSVDLRGILESYGARGIELRSVGLRCLLRHLGRLQSLRDFRLGILARLGGPLPGFIPSNKAPRLEPGFSSLAQPTEVKSPQGQSTSGASLNHTEREGFEPPSPFGRSLSRRVQYHSASAPERQRPSVARRLPAGALIPRNVNNDGTSSVGAPGFEPGTSASRTQRST